MNIVIRLMRDGEEATVNEVYNNAYGNIRPLENFLWEFAQGPDGKAIYVLAEDIDKEGNRIIGTQAAIPLYLVSGEGKKILTAKSEDTYVNPAYRGQKLFERMYELLFDECKKSGIHYIWGFTYARKPFLKLGFEIPFDTVQGVRVIRPIMAFRYLSSLNPTNNLFDKVKILGACILSNIKRIWYNLLNRSTLDVSLSSEIVPNNIWKTNGSQYWNIDMTREYIQWRIKDNPYRNSYTGFFKEGISSCIFNKRPEGFAYLESLTFQKEMNRSERVKLMRKVLRRVDSEFSETSLYRFWGFRNNLVTEAEIELLNDSGFLFIPNKGTGFVWKALDSNGPIKAANLLLSRLFTQGNR